MGIGLNQAGDLFFHSNQLTPHVQMRTAVMRTAMMKAVEARAVTEIVETARRVRRVRKM